MGWIQRHTSVARITDNGERLKHKAITITSATLSTRDQINWRVAWSSLQWNKRYVEHSTGETFPIRGPIIFTFLILYNWSTLLWHPIHIMSECGEEKQHRVRVVVFTSVPRRHFTTLAEDILGANTNKRRTAISNLQSLVLRPTTHQTTHTHTTWQICRTLLGQLHNLLCCAISCGAWRRRLHTGIGRPD